MLKQIVAAAALLAMPFAANAAQIVLTPGSVIGFSGSYGGFPASNILDQQTGTVTEPGQANYWLNPDNGPANAYITVDLGGLYALTKVTLFNTANYNYGDRGTGSFTILGGNSVTAGIIDSPSTVASGVLTAGVPFANPVGETFTATGKFRYISFNPTSVATFGTPCCGSNLGTVYGLGELRVNGFAVVPEPQSWILLIAGFGLVGASMRRRAMLAA